MVNQRHHVTAEETRERGPPDRFRARVLRLPRRRDTEHSGVAAQRTRVGEFSAADAAGDDQIDGGTTTMKKCTGTAVVTETVSTDFNLMNGRPATGWNAIA